jgi:hypothetical protein
VKKTVFATKAHSGDEIILRNLQSYCIEGVDQAKYAGSYDPRLLGCNGVLLAVHPSNLTAHAPGPPRYPEVFKRVAHKPTVPTIEIELERK